MFSNSSRHEEIREAAAEPATESFEGRVDEMPFRSRVVMTRPTGLPWNSRGMPWSTSEPHPALVYFTARSRDGATRMAMFPSKRKADLFSPVPTKQVRTDEAMAAHLDRLHISPDFAGSDDALDSGAAAADDRVADGLGAYKPYDSLEDRLKTAERIVLCERVRRFKSESIIPESLINKLEKPCTSLVLWKPPEKIFIGPGDERSDRNNNPDKDGNTRRSILMSDSNEMDVEL